MGRNCLVIQGKRLLLYNAAPAIVCYTAATDCYTAAAWCYAGNVEALFTHDTLLLHADVTPKCHCAPKCYCCYHCKCVKEYQVSDYSRECEWTG